MTKSKNAAKLFDRAERATKDGDSATCAKLAAELESLVEQEADELQRTRPPSTQTFFDRGLNQTRQSRTPAGDDFEAAAVEGDDEKLQHVRARHEALTLRRDRANGLVRDLRQREKVAKVEEEQANAPARVRELAGQLDEMLDEAEAALAEFLATRERVEAWGREILRARKVGEVTERVLEPEQLYRLGTYLNHKHQEIREAEHNGQHIRTGHPYTRKGPALFGSWAGGEAYMPLLGAPDESWTDRLARLFGGRDDLDERDRKAAIQSMNRIRIRLLAEGQVEKVTDARELARAAGHERAQSKYEHGRVDEVLTI